MTEQKMLFGTDPENQAIAIIFNGPVTKLVLSPEQAEMIAAELLSRAKALKQQQSN